MTAGTPWAGGQVRRRRGAPRRLPDRVAPGLRLLFVGINPGLVSAAAGRYYANPRNAFWRLLHEGVRWNYLVGFVLIVGAAFFVFHKW